MPRVLPLVPLSMLVAFLALSAPSLAAEPAASNPPMQGAEPPPSSRPTPLPQAPAALTSERPVAACASGALASLLYESATSRHSTWNNEPSPMHSSHALAGSNRLSGASMQATAAPAPSGRFEGLALRSTPPK